MAKESFWSYCETAHPLPSYRAFSDAPTVMTFFAVAGGVVRISPNPPAVPLAPEPPLEKTVINS